MKTEELREHFEEIFGKTDGDARFFYAPGRVNLIGEHTDYNGGHVFPCALTLGTYGAARLREDRTVRLASLNAKAGAVHTFSLDEPLVHTPAEGWTAYPKGVFWAFTRRGNEIPRGIDILVSGDIPAGSGLSSSASLEVLTGIILRDMYGMEGISGIELAVLGQRAESQYVGMNCGIMDQFASAMGKADNAIFLSAETLRYEYVPLRLQDAEIVITNSMVKHSLASSEYNTRRAECEKALKKLQSVANIHKLCDMDIDQFDSCRDVIMNDTLMRRARHVVTENARAIRAVSALRVDNLKRFGELMNQSHVSLRDDYEVSCPELDFLAESAWETPGVIGSRMTGGGFGGCTVSIVRKEAVNSFRETIGAKYKDAYGIDPQFYVVEAGDGAREIR